MRNPGFDVEKSFMRNSSRLGVFIALGAAVGVAIGAGSHHVAQGLALGTAFGVAIGILVDRRTTKM